MRRFLSLMILLCPLLVAAQPAVKWQAQFASAEPVMAAKYKFRVEKWGVIEHPKSNALHPWLDKRCDTTFLHYKGPVWRKVWREPRQPISRLVFEAYVFSTEEETVHHLVLLDSLIERSLQTGGDLSKPCAFEGIVGYVWLRHRYFRCGNAIVSVVSPWGGLIGADLIRFCEEFSQLAEAYRPPGKTALAKKPKPAASKKK